MQLPKNTLTLGQRRDEFNAFLSEQVDLLTEAIDDKFKDIPSEIRMVLYGKLAAEFANKATRIMQGEE